MRRSLIGIALLVALVAVGTASAAYPGKNGRLLFFRSNPPIGDLDSNPYEIWTADPSGVLRTMRADGHDKRTVDRPLDPYNNSLGRDRSPTWSPDGTRIAFERTWSTPDSIWAVSAGGGAGQLIPRPLMYPAWSPDGTWFAFLSDGSIGTADIDGSDERILAQNAYPYQPDWSPDGTSIAFAQVRRRIVWVCVAPAAGGAVRCLTHGGEAAWSPDGKQLVYVHAHDIWTIRADGTHRRNVTRTPLRWESNPDWQPR